MPGPLVGHCYGGSVNWVTHLFLSTEEEEDDCDAPTAGVVLIGEAASAVPVVATYPGLLLLEDKQITFLAFIVVK